MQLYGALASPYVARVVMLARIKGVELPIAGMPGGSPASDEYRAINPIAKIPALETDKGVLAESEVICEYVEEVAGGKSALPADAFDRATSRLVSRIVDLYIAPQTGTFFGQMNPAARDQDVVDAAAAELAKGFKYLEHYMGPGPFCVGAEPTLGDCSAAPYLVLIKKTVFANFDTVPDPTEDAGRLGTWWQAIQGNEACRSTVQEYGDAVDAFMKAMAARVTGG